jgi:hypothetical protein
MNKLFMLTACILILGACSQKPLFDRQAGNLRLAIDRQGRITALEDVSDGTNYIQPEEESYLIGCLRYGTDSTSPVQGPISAKILEQAGTVTTLQLSYGQGLRLTVLITPKEGYFRMELTGAEPVSEISQIVWGPYHTTMKGPVGEWLGLNRSNTFTVGLLCLEPNTDGITNDHMPISAMSTPGGSLMQLTSYDHTRGRFVRFKENGFEHLRKSEPIPGLTVIGSSVALFGSHAGKDDELALIEKIELGEGLPHPMFDGKWIKHSREGQKFCMWGGYTEEDFSEYLRLSKQLSARILCRPGGFFSNYGHFISIRKFIPGV